MAPSATLYVQNLNDKVKKADLKRLLYELCLTFGKVVDVVVKKGNMRGQAFVVFSDLQGATQAMRFLDGTSFLDKNLKIVYGKTKSYETIRRTVGDEILYQVKLGLKDPETFKDLDPKKSSKKLTVSGAQVANMEKRQSGDPNSKTSTKKRSRSCSSSSSSKSEPKQEQEDRSPSPKQEKHPADSSQANSNKKVKATHPNNDEDDEEAMEEDSDSEQVVDSAEVAAFKAAGKAPVLSGEEPNPVLFLQGLPSEVTDDMLAVLFQQYPGFQSVRMVPGRAGIAFVQYDTANQSDMAKTALDGFKLAPGVIMNVGFARRT